MKWDIEHFTDEINRLERELAETTLTLDNYRKQLIGLMVIGKEGIACVESIPAGSYNI